MERTKGVNAVMGIQAPGMKDRDSCQLVLAGGVAMAFAILVIASTTMLSLEMDSDRDIEPSLAVEFSHLGQEFRIALIHQYNITNGSAQSIFQYTSSLFISMELQYGLLLDIDMLNMTGASGNETIDYRMVLVSKDQEYELQDTITLIR